MPPSDTPETTAETLADPLRGVGDVASAVRTLAWIHGVSEQPEPIDVFAQAATRLADGEVTFDSVERLLLGLARRGVVTDEQRFALHAIYLRQKA